MAEGEDPTVTWARSLKLHAAVDAFSPGAAHRSSDSRSQLGLDTLVAVLPALLQQPQLKAQHRASLAMRLRRLLHECISIGDGPSLRAWDTALAESTAATAVPRASIPEGHSAWGPVFGFLAFLEVLESGLPAVSRSFARLAFNAATWEGHDVTFHEVHFRDLARTGWCRALSLLPSIDRARSVRLASFSDGAIRRKAATALLEACREACPQVAVLPCSFCEEHHGEKVTLPTPRCLRAERQSHGSKGGGLLLGTGPLRRHSNGTRSFAVELEVLSAGERLDIGVTAQAPHDHWGGGEFALARRARPQVAYAEDLLSSWIVESSGLLVGSHAGLRIRDERWNARNLMAGDILRLTVTEVGEIVLDVNGDLRAQWRAQIPAETPIFPVVDLFEGAPVIRLFP
ncbi:unnamed protein product [Symbiodinium natans]|uniref:NHR domain-containing protein n=1 Tax=Symbiodinium natans TaxID=878477 RepID=A0A812LBG3_9DINO|nr:unnamed protein product [Symbiodinium natans]